MASSDKGYPVSKTGGPCKHEVTRCAGRKLRAHNKKQCRVGGAGWRAKAKRNPKAARFTAC